MKRKRTPDLEGQRLFGFMDDDETEYHQEQSRHERAGDDMPKALVRTVTRTTYRRRGRSEGGSRIGCVALW